MFFFWFSLDYFVVMLFAFVVRSTPLSRPNNIRGGLKCPSVGTYVRPSVHKVFNFSDILYVDRGR